MKSALFLGAGASVFAGHPTTKHLLDRVWARIDRADAENGLSDLARRVVGNREYADVEDLYDSILQMRDICGHGVAGAPSGAVSESVLDEMSCLKSAIRDEVIESFSPRGNYLKVARPMFDLVRSVMGSWRDGLLVFTTNYDLVMENYALIAGLKLVDGFERYQYMTRRWNGLWPDTGNRIPLNLIKLHGSMNWCRDDDGNMLDSRVTPNREDADHDLLIAPTGGAKNYSVEPFSTLLRRFREELVGVDVLLAIGFSYRDRNVVKAIRARLGAGMVLISVSPTAPHDIRRVSGAKPKAVDIGGVTLKTVGRNIILCEMKFGPATYDAVRDALEAAYGLAGKMRKSVKAATLPNTSGS